ncbi:MAG TPA: helix-turn-helix transcriptional regulator [Candidatus Fimivicinus intestinavium]|nr:helix-turn-helix transcriptional regulator [Candidatus Fimivicinus intestinavium]
MKDRIKAVRLALKLSQREFGERLGVSRDVISNLEYGRVQPKELLLRHICELYGVREEWLLHGEGPMFIGDPSSHQRLDEALRLFKTLRPEFQDYALEQIRQLTRLQEGGKPSGGRH